MTGVLDALLPWLAGQLPLQWVGLVLLVAGLVTGWLATFSAVNVRLEYPLGLVAATLSVAFGAGALAIGRYLVVQVGSAVAALPPNPAPGSTEMGGLMVGGLLLFAGMVAAGALLVMGLGVSLVVDEFSFPSADTAVFRLLAGTGLALWIAHEITLAILLGHHGWPL